LYRGNITVGVNVSADYAHLHPAIRPLAEKPADVRIRRIQTDRWIGYPRANACLAALGDLLSLPRRARMPNLLLAGPTNNGKTVIIDRFRRLHGPKEPAASSGKRAEPIPTVVKVQMPSGPDERRFWGAILRAIAFPGAPPERLSTQQDLTVRLMRAANVQMLVIDDVHNLLSGTRIRQRRVLNLMRWLGNELQLPLVAVGTADGLRAIQLDDQLTSRFEPLVLPAWRPGPEFNYLLSTLESILPLRNPSRLAQPALAERIMAASDGILGDIIAVVTRAALRAVGSGIEVITAKLLDEMAFVSPTERRKAAV
jgi:hypothetical protein